MPKLKNVLGPKKNFMQIYNEMRHNTETLMAFIFLYSVFFLYIKTIDDVINI